MSIGQRLAIGDALAALTKQHRVGRLARLIDRPFAWLARRGLGADYP